MKKKKVIEINRVGDHCFTTVKGTNDEIIEVLTAIIGYPPSRKGRREFKKALNKPARKRH